MVIDVSAWVDPATGEVLEALMVAEERIDGAEGDGLLRRWESGRELLARRDGKQLPRGLLDVVVRASGKTAREWQYRMMFADAYADEEKVRNAVSHFGSWHRAVACRFDLARLDEVKGKSEAAVLRDVAAVMEGDVPATLLEVEEPAAMGGDEWYTPRWLFDSLGLTFDIDVCSPIDRAHVSVPTRRYFTVEDDGLKQPWSGTVWCNPPYSTPAEWAYRVIAHGDGLLLTHIPMNAEWAAAVWNTCDGIRLFQGMEFVRPSGETQRPAYWLQLAAFGDKAAAALARLKAPPEVALNPRRVPSPMWVMAEK